MISRACDPSDLKESTETNRKLVEGKNVSMELTKAGMTQVVIYQHKKPFIYQERLLKLQEEAKKDKKGICNL